MRLGGVGFLDLGFSVWACGGFDRDLGCNIEVWIKQQQIMRSP